MILYKEVDGKDYRVDMDIRDYRNHHGKYVSWVATSQTSLSSWATPIQWSSWNTFPELRIIQFADELRGDIEETLKDMGCDVRVFYEFFYEVAYGNYVFPGYYFKDLKGKRTTRI